MSDEFHHCPACARRTRHRIAYERVLAPVMWCQSCFHVHVRPPSETKPANATIFDDKHSILAQGLTLAPEAFISAPLAAAE